MEAALQKVKLFIHFLRVGLYLYTPVFVYFVFSVINILIHDEFYLIHRIVDDAYYYIIVAHNIVQLGESSFLPGVLTNGYHPLWMMLLVAIGSVFGLSLTVVKTLEVTVVATGFVLFVRLFPIRHFVEAAFYTFAIWYFLRVFALKGMETSLLFPALVLLVASLLSQNSVIAARRPLMIFLSCCFVIGTRLDAAFFVLPILAVAPIDLNNKLRILAGLAICAILYGTFNFWYFGAAIPVSASVKSLGGFQFNDKYGEQLVDAIANFSIRRLIFLESIITPWMATLVALLSALALRRHDPTSPLVLLLYAAVIGMLLFGGNLLFHSSWRIWEWYGYPTIAFVLLLVWLIQERLPRKPIITIGLSVLTPVFFVFFVLQTLQAPESKGFVEINRRFLETYGGLLGSDAVAMGDRAGSFAYNYDGGVYQTEGLVNTASYVDILKTGGDIRDHLCSLGITLFLDYEVPLDQDDHAHRIEVLRPMLTSFRGPYITVYGSEEIAQFEDLSIYDNRATDADYRLYAWRLDCERSR